MGLLSQLKANIAAAEIVRSSRSSASPVVEAVFRELRLCRSGDPSCLIGGYLERIAICAAEGLSELDAREMAETEAGATLQQLTRGQLQQWRHKLDAMPVRDTDPRIAEVRQYALNEFTSPWLFQAAAFGWSDRELFGLSAVAPLVRGNAMGLVCTLATAPWIGPITVVSITDSEAVIETGTGARLRAQRFKPGLGQPIWMHGGGNAAVACGKV